MNDRSYKTVDAGEGGSTRPPSMAAQDDAGPRARPRGSMMARGLTGCLALGALAASIAWATTAASTPSVCKLNVCWANQQAKDKFECDSNCYFEENPIDDSPKAVCEVMGKPSHEGSVPYLYRDTAGLATIGIGNMIPDVDAATRMQAAAIASGNAESGFLITEGGVQRQATEQEVRDEFNGLDAQPAGCSNATPKPCKAASHWRSSTSLRVADSYVNELCQGRLADEFIGGLRRTFPDFDQYPTRVKAALYDLVYNMGPSSLAPPRWPGFRNAINTGDWAAAAAESNRRSPVSDDRNTYVRELLEAAGAEEDAGKQRLAQCPLF